MRRPRSALPTQVSRPMAMLMACGLILSACASDDSASLSGTNETAQSTTSATPTAPPTTTSVPPTSTTTDLQDLTTIAPPVTGSPAESYESTVELAETLESVAPGCADSISGGEYDVSQYPAADLSQPGATEFFGIADAGSCFGLFPGLFLFIYNSDQARQHTTVTSAFFGCVLEWTDQVQYVYGSHWTIDAPYIQDFPGPEVARLTGGTFNSQPCELFMDAYTKTLGEAPPPPDTPSDLLISLLGE
jgi:hypothetical protein